MSIDKEKLFQEDVYSIFSKAIDNKQLIYNDWVNKFVLDNDFLHIEIQAFSPEMNMFNEEIIVLCEFKKQTPNSWKTKKMYNKNSKKLSDTIKLCTALKQKIVNLIVSCSEIV